MSLTKVEMWMSIIVLVLVFVLSINLLGGDLRDSDITLNQKSLDYIAKYNLSIAQNDLDTYSNNQTLQEKEKNPLVDFATSLPIISDVVGGINFFIEKTKVVINFLALLYNLPSFFLQGLGLPVGAFSHIINTISAVLLIAISIIAVRLVKWA